MTDVDTSSASTECVLCNRPLGQESKDLGWPYCHDHRKCVKCGEEISLLDAKISARLNDTDPQPKHNKCSLLDKPPLIRENMVAIDERYLNFLNACRLAIIPDAALNPQTNCQTAELFTQKLVVDMTLDEKFLMSEMLTAAATQVNIILGKDKAVAAKAISQKESKKFKEALSEREKNDNVPAPRTFSMEAKRAAKHISAQTGIGISYPDACKCTYQIELNKHNEPIKSWLLIIEAMMSHGTAAEEAERILSEVGIPKNAD